jgi:hypothetical protein
VNKTKRPAPKLDALDALIELQNESMTILLKNIEPILEKLSLSQRCDANWQMNFAIWKYSVRRHDSEHDAWTDGDQLRVEAWHLLSSHR